MIQKLDNTKKEIAEKMFTVFQESYLVEAKLLNIADFPPLNRTIIDYQKSTTHFFGFWHGGFLAAVVELEKIKNTIDICSLVVHPEYFRQGIANKLLEFVQNFDDSGVLIVETGVANEPAILLYKKFGFQEQKTWITSSGINKISLKKVKQ